MMAAVDFNNLNLDSKSLDVLREIDLRGIARGAEIRDRVNLGSAEEFQQAIGPLMASSLVATSGTMSDPREALRSFFSVRPSASGLVKSLLGKG
jgi:hypothetical protein